MDAATTNPTWGYRPSGDAKIFDLALGESLPDGWSASPSVITDPALATGEALTARLQGREYVPPVADLGDDVLVQTGATGGEALALAEIERLNGIIAAGTAENADLVAQIEGAERALDAAAADVSNLRAALLTAEGEKASAVAGLGAEQDNHQKTLLALNEASAARVAAEEQVAHLSADLAKAKADLDEVLAAPPADKSAAKAK